jgi:putative transposase
MYNIPGERKQTPGEQKRQMAKKKRHSATEIATKLGQADILSNEGQTQSEIAKALGISVMTFHRWRKARLSSQEPPSANTPVFGQLTTDTRSTASDRVARITELQLENSRLRKLVTDLLLEKIRLEDEQQCHIADARQHA